MAGRRSCRPVSMPVIKASKVSNAEKCRRYREARKNDPAYKEAERKRKSRYRKTLSDEQKLKSRELARQRMKELRSRKKCLENGSSVSQGPVKTRKQKEEERKKWREAKKKYRANISAQKRRRIREYDRHMYHLKKAHQKLDFQERPAGDGCDGHYKTASAARKAICRLRKKMPSEPFKFSTVLHGLIKSATPTKRRILSDTGVVMTPSKQKKLELLENTMCSFTDMYQTLKASRKKKDLQQRRVMASHLACLKKYRLLRRGTKQLGIRWGTMMKWGKMEFSFPENKRKDALQPAEEDNIQNFYLKPEISVTHAGKKTVLKRLNKQRQTLRRSLRSSYDLFKKDHPESKVSFSKFVKLRPKHVQTLKESKISSCLCEKCINVELMLRVLKIKTLGNKYEASRLSLCSYEKGEMPNIKCAKRKCKRCGIQKLHSHLQDKLESPEVVTWYEWKNQMITVPKTGLTKNKKVLVQNEGEMKVLVKNFLDVLKTFAFHLFCAQWQHKQYTYLKENLQQGQVVCVLDFAENYTTTFQDECQSAHWAKKQITIHPVVNYYLKSESSTSVLKTVEQIFISDDIKHDYHIVHKITEKSLQHLQEEAQVQHLIQFTDGCSAQYKSKIPFMDISFAKEDFEVNFERNFFGSGHGKGPADGCSGVVKSAVTRAVKGRTAVVRDAMEFYLYCSEHLTKDTPTFKRTFYFISKDEINRDRKERLAAVTVQGTRKIHSVRPVKPGKITVRDLTCCCNYCLNQNGEECYNKAIVESWKHKNTSTVEKSTASNSKQLNSDILVSGKDPLISGGDLISDDILDSCEVQDGPLVEDQPIGEFTSVDEALDFMVENMYHPALLNPEEPTISIETESSTSSIHVGQFVEVEIPCGRKFKTFIGLVERVDDQGDVQISFMEEGKTNGVMTYRWPSTPDRSTECIKSVVRILPEPKLLSALSNNRIQYFTFEL